MCKGRHYRITGALRLLSWHEIHHSTAARPFSCHAQHNMLACTSRSCRRNQTMAASQASSPARSMRRPPQLGSQLGSRACPWSSRLLMGSSPGCCCSEAAGACAVLACKMCIHTQSCRRTHAGFSFCSNACATGPICSTQMLN